MTSMKEILRRIEANEAKLNPPPPPEYKVVDMGPVFARMDLSLIAHHEGEKRPDESDLTAFARALKFRDEAELLRIACNDGTEFERRYVAVKPPRVSGTCTCPDLARQIRDGVYQERAIEAANVRDDVIRQFLVEEIV